MERQLLQTKPSIIGKAHMWIFAAICVLLIGPMDAQALEVPSRPKGRVSDYTGTLSAKQIHTLERRLVQFDEETTNQIAVVLISTLAGESLEDYSIRLAEAWQIGQEGRDNGVILLIVKEDRKMRIEVGYGLEGALPDSLAGEILRRVIAPYFEREKFFEGIQAGVDAIIAATKGEYRPEADRPSRRTRSYPWFSLLFPFFFLLALVLGVFRRRRDHPSRRGGGWFIGGPIVWGGGFGGVSGGFGGGFSGGGGGFGGGGAGGGW